MIEDKRICNTVTKHEISSFRREYNIPNISYYNITFSYCTMNIIYKCYRYECM